MQQQVSINVDASLASRIIQREIDKLLGTAPAATSQPDVPALGSYWPGQGGYNGGLVRGENGAPDYYLIVPVLAEQLRAKWGGYGDEVEVAASATDGLANTKALLADSNEHPAAKLASEFTADGHSDFYLPARRELQIAEANVPELFEKAYHWSSTQFSADGAYYMGFEDGWLNLDGKDYERLVRPVRRFIP
ncbi:DUF1566 domain-containing protein [Pseudomonas guariconensis]|uniref:DUF1566 domain-containing protein n=1 Tax=Pseudomonas guariconensis TaxID=1288410 RepID=UPI0018AC8911|nr:DUF1566 domain-containing protein [Pseudomonas guariconensis]MBF8720220.1 DUF1566 domain-containing protein [Pseudomonas guariconensis]